MKNLHIQQDPIPTQSKKGFGVAASPLNGVKMELGIALMSGLALWLVADSITGSITTQLLLLVSYGLISAGWLMARTRYVLQKFESQRGQESRQETATGSGQPLTQHSRSKD